METMYLFILSKVYLSLLSMFSLCISDIADNLAMRHEYFPEEHFEQILVASACAEHTSVVHVEHTLAEHMNRTLCVRDEYAESSCEHEEYCSQMC